MNALLPYLKEIAESLTAMAGGKSSTTSSRATASSSNGSTQRSAAVASGTIEAMGVAEALDVALFADGLNEQEEPIRVSAVKALADSIKEELQSALFQNNNGVFVSYLESIHNSLQRVVESNSLGGLSDVAFLGDTPQPDDFLVCGSNAIWSNMSRDNTLITLMGTESIGGVLASPPSTDPIIDNCRPIYWKGAYTNPSTGITTPAHWEAIKLGGAAYKDVGAIENLGTGLVTGGTVYSYLDGKAATLNVIKSSDLTNNDSWFPSSTGDGYVPTAYAVYTYLTKHYKIAASPDNLDNSSDIITGAVLVAYMNEHGGAAPTMNDVATLTNPDNNHFLYYYKPSSGTAAWKNCSAGDALKKMMGSSPIGGPISTNSPYKKPVYWSGTAWTAIDIGTNYDNISQDVASLATCHAVWKYINQHLSAFVDKGVIDATSAATADSAVVTGNSGVVTARAVAYRLTRFLQGTLKQNGSDINQSASQSDIPSCLAVYDFVTSRPDIHISSFGSWVGGTSDGPTATITLSDNSTVSVPAITPATGGNAPKSGIVTTGTQTFAGAKTFEAALTASALLTASAGISATGVPNTRPAIYATGSEVSGSEAIRASGKVYVTGGNIETAQALEGGGLVIPSSAPSGNWVSGSKWYISIDASAITGQNASSS